MFVWRSCVFFVFFVILLQDSEALCLFWCNCLHSHQRSFLDCKKWAYSPLNCGFLSVLCSIMMLSCQPRDLRKHCLVNIYAQLLCEQSREVHFIYSCRQQTNSYYWQKNILLNSESYFYTLNGKCSTCIFRLSVSVLMERAPPANSFISACT